MYLKKLEIFGFKSFADKTELLFEPGVTAVVGPNGCGKTNVADSIRWVMGEQSAKGLRAGEMTDVIFNGTDSRKPSAMSEVTITLSNEDGALPMEFNEIAVTRRVYRSGESEYLINKAVARLRDVKELFMGTGLGVGAYSVLAQGQMDQIVTSKPIERRAIFEEAAGITKYKARKAEAIRKLDATEQNLVRISDITAEIKRQISTLERQAKQAEKYRQHKEELARLQVLLHLDKAAKLRHKLKDLHHRMGSVKGRLEEAQDAAHSLEQEERQQRTLLEGIDGELSQVREAAYKAQSEVEVTEGRMDGAKRHKGMLSDQRRRNEQGVAEAGGRIGQLKAWVTERLELLRNKDGQRREKENLKAELATKLAALESELSTGDKDLETKNHEALDLLHRAAQMKAELESLKSQDEETSRRVADLESRVNALSKEIMELEGRFSSFAKEKTEVQASEGQADEDILRFQGDMSAQGTRIEEVQERIQKLHNEVSETRSRLGVLEELQNKLTGYDAGVKEILRAKQVEPLMWQGVLGIVADLLVVDKEHESAVESLLGSQLQSLVVETKEVARKVAAHLRAQGQGKVSLFILEDLIKFPVQGLPPEAHAQAGVEGPVRSFLRHDAKMEPVVRFLFEQDLLVSDEGTAERLDALYPTGRFVTRDGDRWGPLGTLKAGSPSVGVSLLGRHREMSELSERSKGLEASLQACDEELSGLKRSRKGTEDSFLEAETRRQGLRIRSAELEKELTQTQETLTRLGAQRASEEREKVTAETHWKADQARVGELSLVLSESEKAHQLTQDAIAGARKNLQDLQARREEASRLLLQAGLELSSLEEVALRSQEEADRYQKEAEQLTQSVAQKAEENRQLDLQEQQLSLDLDDLLRRVGGLQQSKQEADSKVVEIQSKREKVAAETEERAGKVRKARAKAEEVQRELHGLEVTQAQHEVETRTIEEKLQVEYKVDLEAPPVALEEGFDPDAAERECVELRARIERLGLVNMVAVEEYDELSQRYKFLSEQRDDLLKAKDDLQKAIHKINLTSKELFATTFATVQENFKDIFQRLFEGGRAELILIDEGDVLESGIEIVARPPGKRLQSVSLLSGGEKALTAIALLFALFMVKPSPFCLLDEIDAPLDDVNVGRFTHLLKEFAKRTQFIMITHNKVSMETADVMYGVTMQESGVSKILSTRFREGAPEGSVSH